MESNVITPNGHFVETNMLDCPECGKVCRGNIGLKVHMDSHTVSECKYCGRECRGRGIYAHEKTCKMRPATDQDDDIYALLEFLFPNGMVPFKKMDMINKWVEMTRDMIR